MAAEMLRVEGATKMDAISVLMLMLWQGSVMNSGAQNKFIHTGPRVRTHYPLHAATEVIFRGWRDHLNQL
jgi:hypothetical protein